LDFIIGAEKSEKTTVLGLLNFGAQDFNSLIVNAEESIKNNELGPEPISNDQELYYYSGI
jgi:hypothetical protein